MVFSSCILMEEIKLCKDMDFWPTDKIVNNTLEQQRYNTSSKLSKGMINKFKFKHLGANIDKTIFAQSDLDKKFRPPLNPVLDVTVKTHFRSFYLPSLIFHKIPTCDSNV